MITDSQVLLDCCSREMKRVKGWGEQNSSNIITEDLPKVSNAVIFSLTNLFFKHFCVLTLLHKAAYASQPLHLETAPSLSPDRGPGCRGHRGDDVHAGVRHRQQRTLAAHVHNRI